MSDDEVLARIDRSLERIDAHMARGNELMAEVRAEMEANRRERAELRQFMRELLLRWERATGAIVERLEEQTEMIREHRREFVEESRAGRAALFRMLDRLGPAGGAA